MVDELVTVASFEFLAEADVARIALEAAGIPAFLADVATLGANWFWGNAIGYIKLQVPRDLVEESLAILQQMRAQSLAPTDRLAEDSDATKCLACGAELPAGQSTCSACGWSYLRQKNERS